MTLSSRQVAGLLVVLGFGVAFSYLAKDATWSVLPVMFAGLLAIFFAGSGTSSASLGGAIDAARRAGSGDRAPAPADATPETRALYDAIGELAEMVKKTNL